MIEKTALCAYSNHQRALYQNSECVYLRPDPRLGSYISNYTLSFPNQSHMTESYTIIPHGCATLVFALRDQVFEGKVFGPATKAALVGDQAITFQQIMIVEFQPGGLGAFITINQQELADHLVDLDLLHDRLNAKILVLLERSETIENLLQGLDQLFLTYLTNTSPKELQFSTQQIIQHQGVLSLSRLSETVFYSERHLTRLFNEHLGMSSKVFSRLVRINQAIRLLQNPTMTIRQVYEQMAYYDVSHFNRAFKQISGCTPTEYRQKMSDFYSEIAKF
ncbi:AraC family transcriptional regulator [Enterococcus florum]|uniref:AraC family transcriptional regulator n=1 Tax=Enterococcus florum TaxID=2480627 RepID=A0A4P5P947_9ENTE|nr:AraC family transcriptional regulator [Enterococcus florum]GCF94076.1 AraC family transcriptional regulator [Enterococcus florum]